MLLAKLDVLLVKQVEPSLEPALRATAMSEIIDSILQTPFPVPHDMIITRAFGKAKLWMSPEDSTAYGDDLEDGLSIDVFPSTTYWIDVSGRVPSSMMCSESIPFHRVVVYPKVSYVRPLHVEEGEEGEEEDLPPSTEVYILPLDCQLHPQGTFFLPFGFPGISEEGVYSITAKLACRDVRGTEWDVPFEDVKSTGVKVRVSRSR